MTSLWVGAHRRRNGFSPLSLPSLAGWWDASDTSTITSSSGAVSQWQDKSGLARHLAQSSAGLKPVTGVTTKNGRNVLNFDGGDSLLYDHGSLGLSFATSTLLMALVSTSSTSNRRIASLVALSVDYATGSGVLAFNNGGANWATYASNSGGSKAYTLSSWFVGRSTLSATSSTVAVNGSTNTVSLTSGISSVQRIYIGGTNFEATSWVGSVGEIILCNTVLGGTDLTAAEAYLTGRWM